MQSIPVNEITPESVNSERSSQVNIGGKNYDLLLTTLATKAISQRYGGLENLGDKLKESEKFEDVIEEICWLIALLANQSSMIWNLSHEDKKDLLTVDDVMLLTSPYSFIDYKDAIMTAMVKGSKRNIVSEEEPQKNVVTE